jgi:hypothetical protein
VQLACALIAKLLKSAGSPNAPRWPIAMARSVNPSSECGRPVETLASAPRKHRPSGQKQLTMRNSSQTDGPVDTLLGSSPPAVAGGVEVPTRKSAKVEFIGAIRQGSVQISLHQDVQGAVIGPGLEHRIRNVDVRIGSPWDTASFE